MNELGPIRKPLVEVDKFYILKEPLKRVIGKPVYDNDGNIVDPGINANLDISWVELPTGIIVKCVGIDAKGRALFVIQKNEELGNEYTDMCFPSSVDTQVYFQAIDKQT